MQYWRREPDGSRQTLRPHFDARICAETFGELVGRVLAPHEITHGVRDAIDAIDSPRLQRNARRIDGQRFRT
jgi:hypothetical protein